MWCLYQYDDRTETIYQTRILSDTFSNTKTLLKFCRENKYYNINTFYNFKAPTDANIKTGDVIEAVTNAHENLCGGYLPLNTELLITGIYTK